MRMNWRRGLDRALSWSTGWPVWLRYGTTILTVCAVGFAWNHINNDRPYLLFFPAIILCAVVFDRGSGYVATLVAAIFIAFLMLPPVPTGAFFSSDPVAYPVFIFSGLMIAGIVETLRERIKELAISEKRAVILASDRGLLLDELSHRTRNDLANVVTLLNLQAAKAQDEARESLKAAAERVRTISRVHRQLEIADQRVVVDSKEFLEELCIDLQTSRLAERAIGLVQNFESHAIGIEKAVPLGLIVNELITNAVKHAFPGDRVGKIDISFQRDGAFYILTVQDDGIGGVDSRPGTGTQLLRLLAGQLGTYETGAGSTGIGTRVIVRVRVKATKQFGSGASRA